MQRLPGRVKNTSTWSNDVAPEHQAHSRAISQEVGSLLSASSQASKVLMYGVVEFHDSSDIHTRHGSSHSLAGY